jgi:hypothetical protein
MLPVNVTIYVLNLTRAESPIFDTMDNSPGSTIREILVVAVLPRHARFFWGWEHLPVHEVVTSESG